MKKLLPLLPLLLIIISVALASCKADVKDDTGSSRDSSASSSESETEKPTTLSSQRAQGVAIEIEKGRFDSFEKYSDEEKKLIKESVEADGYTLEYNDDGSATLSNEEGSWLIGTGWTENDYTDGVPAPDFGTVTMAAEDEEKEGQFYIFLIRNATAQQASDYVKKLEEAGFKPTQEKTDDVKNNVVVFTGKNDGGKKIEFAFTTNGLTIKIFK